MTQAERYIFLHEQMDNKFLDSSYQAALFILSCEEMITRLASPFVSSSGIDFLKILERMSSDDYHQQLVGLAYNLFRWDTDNYISPHEISRLPCPYINYALQAIFISSGLHKVEIQSNDGEETLIINESKYEQAEKLNEIMRCKVNEWM